MKNYFSKHYARLNRIDISSDASFKKWYDISYTYYSELIPQLVESLKGLKILELGCGIGGFLFYLRKENHVDFLGVDNSDEQLSYCKKYVSEKVINEDALVFLSKNTIKYDLIVLFDFIEHIDHDRVINFLYLIFRSLTTNGKVVIRTPNMSIPLGLHNRYIDFTHQTGFTEHSLQQVLVEAGFNEMEFKNDLTGEKRLFAANIIQRFLCKVYNIEPVRVVTRNIIAIAKK